ncbi:sigma-54-dependent Fis family transcriptional regulator [Falsiroseomonas bella]|uniref:Sigma-54-dependent Fis family transcriptional regulator n=1 Tax=Falsiroseomonas bella TaxID=2184016 RepID=A0A317F864_9PROT|nr:sigma-54 dependent transcriptional regulator [Falsiroseomonas bella]PWS35244.1 sigma-54-dependent Fis family transcriptional regulator [Falsiroseomonas bella]
MSELAGCSVVMIEDDAVLGRSIVQLLRLSGVVTYWAKGVAEGETLLRRHRPTMVLCDMRLPDGSGEALIARLMPELGGTPVVAMTAFSGVEQAVRMMRAGVDDYLPKPFEPQRLLDKLAAYASRSARVPGEPEVVAGWRSPPMRALAAALERVAQSPATLLLRGESGVGKGVAAKRLHGQAGPEAPFVAVDCAALPSTAEEAEAVLFGRGDSPGLLDSAGGGTLFLDEVAELGPPLQARLLGLVEERSYAPPGVTEPRRLRARIVAASNADLAGLAGAGTFRQDLLFRLSVVELVVPPLRERPEDLTDLADHFLEHFSRASGEETKHLGEDAVDALLAHRWPGNVRELRNRMELAVLLAPADEITRADLFPAPAQQPDTQPDAALPLVEHAAGAATACTPEPASLAEARDAAEREHIRRVLARCRGKVGDAARALGVSRTTLWERMRRLGPPSR